MDHHAPYVIIAFLQSARLAVLQQQVQLFQFLQTTVIMIAKQVFLLINYLNFSITVDPVVVIPLTASKKASVKLKR